MERHWKGPLPADHVHSLQSLAVRSSFEDEDGDILIFSESTGYNTPCCPASGETNVSICLLDSWSCRPSV